MMSIKELEYISGPCTFREFNFSDTNFLFFGEEHSGNQKCSVKNTLAFDDFLEQLSIENPDKIFD